MTVNLGGITLHDNLRLLGLETSNDISVSSVTTLGGLSVTTTMPLAPARSLSLVAPQSGDTIKGHFTLDEINQIKAIATAGIPVTLTHHRGIYSVIIVSTASLTPVIDKAAPEGTDWYTGTIQLIEV